MEATARLRTLGGLAVEGLAFGRSKPLQLVAYLAVEGERDRRHIAELFWPTAADHMKSLTVALAQTRKAAPGLLDADASRIRTRLESDAATFLERLDAGDPQGALALYRGPFLDGVRVQGGEAELEEWIYHTREVLAARARAARLQLAEAAAGRGAFERAARLAEEALELRGAPPLDPADLQRLHALLLAGGGARAAELRAEAEGFDLPLAADRDAARARFVRSRPAPFADHLRTQRRATSFVGRERERAEVAGLLAGEWRLVTLVGPGGVGKTRLALQVADDLERSGAYSGGVRFVPLDALPPGAEVVSALAEALDLGGGADALRRLVDDLGDASILIVLDNVEPLVETTPELAELLRRCPGLRLLATSRELLRLEEEVALPVRGLPYPDALGPDLEPAEAERYDAVALFVQRARRARPDFRLTPEELPHVLAICALVEGMPLGLELAAAAVRVLPCREIAAEMGRSLDLLVTPARNVPERHRSLQAAFAYSWRLLSERERALLADLAAFRGGFTRAAAAAVAGATIPLLAALVDKSLLRLDGDGRYGFHPLLQQYAAERLAERGAEAARLAEAHGRHYFALLHPRENDLDRAAFTAAVTAIDDEWENLRRMFAWSLESGDLDVLERCVDAVELCYERRGAFAEGLAYLEALEGVAERLGAGPRLLGRARVERAWYHYRLGQLDAASTLAAESAEVLREAGDHWESKGHNTIGCAALYRGDLAAARTHLEEALAVAIRHDDVLSTIALQNNLATALVRLGELDGAEELLREAHDASRSLGKPHRTIFSLAALAEVRTALGRHDEAEAALAEALRIADEIGDRLMTPQLSISRSQAALAAGDPSAAARHAERARRDALAAHRPPLVRAALLQRAHVDLAAGEADRARRGCREVLRRVRDADDRHLLAPTLRLAAELDARDGEPRRALELLAFVAAHPATGEGERAAAEAAIAGLAGELGAHEVDGAVARGAAQMEVGVVAAVLGDEAP